MQGAKYWVLDTRYWVLGLMEMELVLRLTLHASRLVSLLGAACVTD